MSNPDRVAIIECITSMTHDADNDRIILTAREGEGTVLSQLVDAIVAAVAPTEAAAVPAGWRLVPLVPTKEMKAAAVVFANGSAVYKNVAAGALEIEEDIYGEAYDAMLAAAPQALAVDTVAPAEPVYWEYRWKDTHPQNVTSGQWYPWEKVKSRSGLETVESRLAELRGRIAMGLPYELRALYAAQPPVAGQPAEADAIVGWEIEYEHFGPALTTHKARADEAVRLGFPVHALGRLAAPKGDSNG